LLNHLITDEIPFKGGAISNSDPVAGQAGWYDVRVRIRLADATDKTQTTSPQVSAHHSVRPQT
jgi:hypothetical protein